MVIFCHTHSLKRMLSLVSVWITGLCRMSLLDSNKVVWLLHTYNSRWGHVDAGDRAGPHVVGQVAQNDAVRESRPEVAGQWHLQPRLDVLWETNRDTQGSWELHSSSCFILHNSVRGRVPVVQLCPSSWHFPPAFWITPRKALHITVAQGWPQSGSNWVQWKTVYIVQHSELIKPWFKNNGNQDLGTVFLTLHILREWFCRGKWK